MTPVTMSKSYIKSQSFKDNLQHHIAVSQQIMNESE